MKNTKDTHIIQIAAKERDAVAKSCALIDVPCRFYTVEKNPNLLTVEIEATPVVLYSIARMVEYHLQLASL